jgi:3-phenylpropionate/trans-cinnamate dioxygenase ferredoxin reductase subunit
VRIEHWVLAQRQGQAVARTIAGDGGAFIDVPFFWSQHYDLVINYVGHAAKWDRLEIDGSLAERSATVTYRLAGKVKAVATVARDQDSLRAEVAMEQARR